MRHRVRWRVSRRENSKSGHSNLRNERQKPTQLRHSLQGEKGHRRSRFKHGITATGMDAFVHNLEAYCAKGYHPMADGIALQAMTLINKWLPLAYSNGDNLEARSHMLAASMMGAVAFQKGLGAVHALAHPLGALYDKHHGLLNAILLPYVLQHNKPAIEKKLTHISRVLDLDEVSYDGFMQWILQFRKTLQIPDDLKSIGINIEQSELVGEMASKDPSAASNPVSLSAEQYSTLFEKAVTGQLS